MSLHAKGVNYGIYSDEGKCSHHTRTTYQTTMLHEAKGARACVDVCVDVCGGGGAPLCLLVFTTLTTTTNLLNTNYATRNPNVRWFPRVRRIREDGC